MIVSTIKKDEDQTQLIIHSNIMNKFVKNDYKKQ